jgi:Zn-dependent peptidase ImmA (M78 family)/transcriptional regulator with XRE-family HTH domain
MIGTAGFVGERLVEAREARALTAVALSELLGVKPQVISQYESGKHSPRPEMMRQIAEKLNLPEVFFKRLMLAEEQENAIFWRSFSFATKRARMRCVRRFGWLKEIVSYLEGFLDFPAIRVPNPRLPTDASNISEDEIENIASECRDFWGLGGGPIADLFLQLENNGIVVTRTRFDAIALDAFSQWNNLPYIVVGSDKEASVRARFDAAHELGHLILHRNLSSKAVSSLELHRSIEAAAFRFAAAFLLPAKQFLADLWAPTLDAFRSLKDRWRVSIGVMIHRCSDLGLISDEQAKFLWINYTRRGWKRDEPLDDRLPMESPRLLRRSFDLLLTERIKTKNQILLDLPFSASDIEALAGLPTGYFSDDFGEVIAMPTVKHAAKTLDDTQRRGRVLPFTKE